MKQGALIQQTFSSRFERGIYRTMVITKVMLIAIHFSLNLEIAV